MEVIDIPEPPTNLATLVPEEDKSLTFHIETNLRAMRSYTLDFYAALKLYDFSSKAFDENEIDFEYHQLRDRWMIISGKDAILTIYNFIRLIQENNSAINTSPSLRAMINFKEIAISSNIIRLQTHKTDSPGFENVIRLPEISGVSNDGSLFLADGCAVCPAFAASAEQASRRSAR